MQRLPATKLPRANWWRQKSARWWKVLPNIIPHWQAKRIICSLCQPQKPERALLEMFAKKFVPKAVAEIAAATAATMTSSVTGHCSLRANLRRNKIESEFVPEQGIAEEEALKKGDQSRLPAV